MSTRCLLLTGLSLLAAFSLKAESTDYQVVEKGLHHKRYQRTEISDSGESVVHEYTELATGLMYLDDKGDLQDSAAEFTEYKDGFVAQRGQMKVILSTHLQASHVDVLTDAGRFVSHCLGMSLYDPVSGQNAILAEMKSVKGERVAPDTVVYWDCLKSTIKGVEIVGSLRYRLSLSGIEQDVILHKLDGLTPQILAEAEMTEAFRMEIMTEFVSCPEGKIKKRLLKQEPDEQLRAVMAEPDLEDNELEFGEEGLIRMGQGKAFSLNAGEEVPTDEIEVAKQWLDVDGGRTVLVEQVEFSEIEPLLEKLKTSSLPANESDTQQPANHLNNQPSTINHQPSHPRLIPQAHFASVEQEASPRLLAQERKQGVVVDYLLSLTSGSNLVLAGDATYYVSGTVNIASSLTLMGGVVLKYTNGSSLNVSGTIVCSTRPGQPGILTAKDDNTVGATISGSSGNPSGYYGIGMNVNGTSSELHDLVFRNLNLGLCWDNSTGRFYNLRFAKCNIAIRRYSSTAYHHNILINNCNNGLLAVSSTLTMEHLTVDQCTVFGSCSGSILNLKNSVLANITTMGTYSQLNASYNGRYNCPTFTQTAGYVSMVNPFVTSGAGSHYLSPQSGFHNVGTTTINSQLASELQTKTTYAPEIKTGTISTATVWQPQAALDTGLPDLGYHYEKLDYLVSGVQVDNTTLTLTNGVAIGVYGQYGVVMKPGSQIISEGHPAKLNKIMRYSAVQENVITAWNQVSGQRIFKEDAASGTKPVLKLRLTELTSLADGAPYLDGGNQMGTVSLMDCVIGSGLFQMNVTGSSGRTLELKNNLWDAVKLTVGNSVDPILFYAYNNTFLSGTNRFYAASGNSWQIKDNLFYLTKLPDNTNANNFTHTNNGYVSGQDRLGPPQSGDKLLSSNPFESGPLGDYYINSSGRTLLKGFGSRLASVAGLYHHTIQADQEKESTTQVDIGYHYLAVNTTTLSALDNDGDGLADYMEDRDGDGTADTGERNWQQTQTTGMSTSNALEVWSDLK